MRKALLPMIALLLLCGAATIALIATNARAEQGGHKPMMIAVVTPGRTTAAPPADAGSQSSRGAMRDGGFGREQICRDVYANKAGELAFLEAKLSLDAKQAPLFARWKQASLEIAKQNEGDCAGPRRDLRRPSAVDRMALEEELLKKRLANIQAERPSLTALYNALTPAQKEEFSRSDARRMPGRFNVMFGMLDRPHPGMEMMRPSQMGGPMSGPVNGPMGGPPEPPALAR
jgi:Spy/CpxP family protein refolding chaperone